jgi:hypothetical protein
MFGRRSFRIEGIVFFLRSLAIFGYFHMRFYIGGRITVFGIIFNLGYRWEILNSRRDLSKQMRV